MFVAVDGKLAGLVGVADPIKDTTPDLHGIVRARALSRATMSNIKQNLLFAFGHNAAGVPIAAGVLYPLTGWLLSPMLAVLAMSLSSVSVIGNALRLRRASIAGATAPGPAPAARCDDDRFRSSLQFEQAPAVRS